MRDLKERFGGLPFSIGCVSVSSVAVIDDHPNKSNAEANPAKPKECGGEGEERCNNEKVVKSPSHGAGFSPVQKLIKSFKSFSQRLSYRQEEDEDEMVEMEIGLPTDVIHVGHIGWDGSTNTIGGNGDGSSSSSTSKIMSLSSAYLKQIELAMAAHADVASAQ